MTSSDVRLIDNNATWGLSFFPASTSRISFLVRHDSSSNTPVPGRSRGVEPIQGWNLKAVLFYSAQEDIIQVYGEAPSQTTSDQFFPSLPSQWHLPAFRINWIAMSTRW
jgi:hypothetical protein